MKFFSATVVAVLAAAQCALAAPSAASLERRCTVDDPNGWIPGTTCDNGDQCASCSCIYGDTPIGQDWICA